MNTSTHDMAVPVPDEELPCIPLSYVPDTDKLNGSRAQASSSNVKHDLLWSKWKQVRSGLLSDMEKNLKKQESLITLFLNDARNLSSSSGLPAPADSVPLRITSSSHLPTPSSPRTHAAELQKPPFIKDAWQEADSLPTSISLPTAISAPTSSKGIRSPSKETIKTIKRRSQLSADKSRKRTSLKTMVTFHDWEFSEKHSQFLREHKGELENIVYKFQVNGGRMSEKVDGLVHRYGMLLCIGNKEPPRHGWLVDLVRSRWFTCLSGMVILFDSIFTAVTADYSMRERTDKLPRDMQCIEILLVLFYLTELVMKICVHRLFFFINADWVWNLFDFVLVVQGVTDIFLTHVSGKNGANVQFMRLVRLMKLGKVLRLVRTIRFFRDLRVMAKSIAYSVNSMFWAFVMFALILYIAALFFIQMLSGYVAERGTSLESNKSKEIYRLFGSVGTAALTLYQSSSGGVDWEVVYNVVKLSGPISSMGFIFFIWFFNFAVLNILSGIFIEKAMTASVPDREQLAFEKRKADERDAKELTLLINSMDVAGKGTITLDDFLVQAHDEYANAYLKTLGISIDDATLLFNLLRGIVGSGELPINDFVGKLVRVKGEAKALDLQSVAFEVSVIRGMVTELAAALKPPEDE